MKTPDSEDLLNDILTAEDELDFRRQTLARGLAALRQRARRRRIARACAFSVIPCLLVLGGIALRAHHRANDATENQSRVAAIPPSSPPRSDLPPVKIINDEQLFALFPDRPLALVGKPGNQQLVFLDRVSSSKSD